MGAKTKVEKSKAKRSRRRVHVMSRDIDPNSFLDSVLTQKSAQSQQLEDSHKQDYGAGGELAVLEPPFNPENLRLLPVENNTLLQCIEALTINIESFGHRLEYIGEEGQEGSEKVKAEKSRISALLDNPNGEYSFIELRKRYRKDYENFGWGTFEVVRQQDNSIAMLLHIDAASIRKTKVDDADTPIKIIVLRNGTQEEVKMTRQFRRYVQRVNQKKVYFKEFGDPRTIDPKTGKVDEVLAFEDSANEILFLKQGTGPYGHPKWINQLPAILGSRESELVNLSFFQENGIPAMAILVSGGALTEETMQDLKDKFVITKGKAQMHRVLVIEAEPTGETALQGERGPVPPKLEMKPLVNERQGDALFQDYDKNNRTKVRSSFRLPPLFIGLCHSWDTQYLTQRGWLDFDSVSKGDKLATYNRDTNEIEYRPYSERHKLHYEGDMLHFKNRGFDALVTPNHRMLIRPNVISDREGKPWELVEASKVVELRGGLNNCMEMRVSSVEEHQAVDTFEIPKPIRKNRCKLIGSKNIKRDLERSLQAYSRNISMDTFLLFLGYFISEGSYGGGGHITISQNEGELLEDISNIVSDMGFDPHTKIYHGEGVVSFSHLGLSAWLKKHAGKGAKGKRIPPIVFNTSIEQRKLFLHALINGDGSIPKLGAEGSFAYCTTSKGLNDDLHRLCFGMGIALTSRAAKQRNIKWNTAYCSYGCIKYRKLIKKNQIIPVKYKGFVHCFTVPNGVLVTKRNGRVLISGNSEEYSRATAEASLEVAESQVFGPERNDMDTIIHFQLLQDAEGRPPQFWRFRSNAARLTSPESLVEMIEVMDKVGAMTPNIAINILNESLGLMLEPIGDPWANLPFSIVSDLLAKGELGEAGEQAEIVLKRLEAASLLKKDK